MTPHDDDARHALTVIDRTLAGEPVAPEDAVLAELSLILAAERPQPRPAFTTALDARVAAGFDAPALRGARPRRRWWLASGSAAVAALVAAVVIVVSAGTSTPIANDLSARGPNALSGASAAATSTASSGAAATRSAASSAAPSPNSGASAGSVSAGSAASSGVESVPSVELTPPGRQVIRGAQLSLSTRPRNVETVAQEVFAVMDSEHGVVDSSTVTANNSATGYAVFQLSVPNGASVLSRTDTSQDVTDQTAADQRRLNDARAQRTALLRQLALATTTAAIDSLNAQLHDADATIARDLSAVQALGRQVSSSQISLTINASMLPVAHRGSTGGFTLGRATHDAGRVLVVAAGVALIALAVLAPLGLLVALALWLGLLVRRHRREQALEL
jgi:uncharacterized membrane protein (Fun14 family)